ncbi:hypothetical protein DACRYDRAFT_100503 [Dacryopinax primogenitus]|uniref:Uncharacterized protein n=1 Tax=Dacryopinax primogenitus (strain DJM 731) TaxID=1858805 RepID=M5FTD1_DACPD|nr:uncharacterized protein DACRYDRAFT_100503 [Dacryopinax primogenitus]EJU00886.1 hypothetical protein DACRYDRAFT_100503 [Dacryopinax primogenitus]
MVITKEPLTPDGSSLDTPPSYDSLSTSSSRPTGDQKRPIPPWPPNSQSAQAGSSHYSLPSPPSRDGPASAKWSPLTPEYWRRRREEDEIRRTVRDLLKDVIHNLSDPSSLDVLHSSYVACASHGISFPSLSQELIESHPPLYWAVLTLSPLARALPGGQLASSPPPDGWSALDLLTAFPLKGETQREAIAACVLGDDNALFQYLRASEGFAPQGLAESIISRPGEEGRARAVDFVHVEHVPDGQAGHFKIRFKCRDWLRRMRMHKKIVMRWIARGRAWQLVFGMADGSQPVSQGNWYCAIALVRGTGSNNAPLTAQIQIGNTDPLPPTDRLTPGTFPPPTSASDSPERKTVTLKLQHRDLRDDYEYHYCVKLSDFPGAASLEYEDSPFIEPDGSVCMQGDFVLEKS